MSIESPCRECILIKTTKDQCHALIAAWDQLGFLQAHIRELETRLASARGDVSYRPTGSATERIAGCSSDSTTPTVTPATATEAV